MYALLTAAVASVVILLVIAQKCKQRSTKAQDSTVPSGQRSILDQAPSTLIHQACRARQVSGGDSVHPTKKIYPSRV